MRELTVEDNVAAHVPGRDIWTPEKRREHWETAQAMHELNRDKQERRPFNNFTTLWSADVGEGKTLCAAAPVIRQYLDGMPLACNVSFEVGIRLEGMENYNLDSSTADNSNVVLDEAHLIVNKYSAISLRQVHFNNEMASFRKGGKRLSLMSAEEDKISSAVKTEIDWVQYPVKYVPSVVRRGGNWPGLPPWCYVKIVRIGPRPWRGQRLADRLKVAGIARPPVRVYFDYPNPVTLFKTSVLINSFEKPNLQEALLLDARAARASWEGELGEPPPDEAERDVFADIFNGIAVALGNGEKLKTYNEYQYIASLVRKYGPPPPLSNEDVLAAFRETKIPISSRLKIKKSDLLEALDPMATGREV